MDVLVLAKCKQFVGLARSSMSLFVRELRMMHGQSRETTQLLGGPLGEREAGAAILVEA